MTTFVNIVDSIIFLIGLAAFILGILGFTGIVKFKRAEWRVNNLGKKFLFLFFIALGLEIIFMKSSSLFKTPILDTHFLITSSSGLILSILMSLCIFTGWPNFGIAFLPNRQNQRFRIGIILIIFGITSFFRLTDDYFGLTGAMEDIIFFVHIGSLIYISLFSKNNFKQINEAKNA